MKKFISLFLVISMIMCNLNTKVVEALSSCGKEAKSLVDTLSKTYKKENVNVKDDKVLDKETTQIPVNKNVDNISVVDSKGKETTQDKKTLDKKLSTDDQSDDEQIVTLIYDISSSDPDEYKVENADVSDPQEVNLIITGTGSDKFIEFDNEWDCDIPFNIELKDICGTNCNFSFEHVKSISVKGKNKILNSSSDEPALTYSFSDDDSNPLKIDTNSSFIVYNKDKETIDNNIVYSGDLGEPYENSGGTTIVNMSFEDDNLGEESFILELIGNKEIQKKFSTKDGYNALSILLIGDNNEYLLKEEKNKDKPYYYRSIDFSSGNGQISTPIKTKFILKKDSSKNYYSVSNKSRVEVIATQKIKSNSYLVENLKQAMDVCGYLETFSHEIVFLGDYSISKEDVEAIKNYKKSSNEITFKTKVDDWIYLLNIDENLELMVNNSNIFPITFDNIKFNYSSDDKWIYANSREVKFGYNVEMIGTHYPSVSLGGKTLSQNTNVANDCSLIINSGTYNTAIGDYYGISQNVNIIINEGTFKNKFIGVGSSSNVGEDLDIVINGGTFYDEVIVVEGNVGNDAILTIQGGAFYSKVLGSSDGSNIEGCLEILVDGGIFKHQVIGINGGFVGDARLVINGGTFYDIFTGASSNTTKEKVTLNGLRNRYLFTTKQSTTLKSGNLNIEINGATFNKQVYGIYSGITGININLEIKSGNFKKDIIGTNESGNTPTIKVNGGKFKGNLIGNSASENCNAVINIDGKVDIPIIKEFSKLILGKTKKGTSLKVNKLDKGYSTGDLYLNNRSTVSFNKSNETTSKLNNIELNGENNTLSLQAIERNKDKVLIELSGNITNNNCKLNIEFNNKNTSYISEIYLIKFTTLGNEDVENKYILPEGYYIRDKQESEIGQGESKSGYAILYPQTTFDLKYDLKENKLYMINSGSESGAWWYNMKDQDIKNINLDTNGLYKYKGYDLFKGNDSDRNIILTGTSSDKNVTVNNNLDNVNVELDRINLTDSSINLNNIKTLIVKGANTINSINANQPVFTYTFNGNQTSDKVLFKGDNSYLKICTNKNANPFDGAQGNCIDLKFYKPFKEEHNEVRLKNKDTNSELNFTIPTGTDRLGLLLKDKGSYNLYYGEGDTGSSVYVAGNTDKTFTDTFATSSNTEVYDYVRRANPVSTIDVQMPSEVNFGVHVRTNTLDSVTEDNWQDYFYTTDMKFKNNSTVVKDQFTDENGVVHQFGKASNTDTDINLEYMGVYSSEDSRNGIELVSNDKLDSNIITDSTSGVKLALNLDDTSIDEFEGTKNPLKSWVIKDNGEIIIPIKPNFGTNNNFFNISKYLTYEFKLNSSHIFIFRYGLKE